MHNTRGTRQPTCGHTLYALAFRKADIHCLDLCVIFGESCRALLGMVKQPSLRKASKSEYEEHRTAHHGCGDDP